MWAPHPLAVFAFAVCAVKGNVSDRGAGSNKATGMHHPVKSQIPSCPASPMTKKARPSSDSCGPAKLNSEGVCRVQIPPASLDCKDGNPQINKGEIPAVSAPCTSLGESSVGTAAVGSTPAAANHSGLNNTGPGTTATLSAGVVSTTFSGFMARGLAANAKPVNPPALGLGSANGNDCEEENKPPRKLVSSGDFIVRLRLARCLQPRHWRRQKRPFCTCLVCAVIGPQSHSSRRVPANLVTWRA